VGAAVIGVDRNEPRTDTPAAEIIEAFIPFDPAADVGSQFKRLTGGRGADVVYDTVGGVTTPAALASLAHGGRLVVISAVGPRVVEVDLIDLYHNKARILGSDGRKFNVVASATRLKLMGPYFDSGAFRPLPIVRSYPLDQARAAYQAVADHTQGRVVLVP
jgi:NADPH:quinone reductase-like Zn-dependent oxidoreductase